MQGNTLEYFKAIFEAPVINLNMKTIHNTSVPQFAVVHVLDSLSQSSNRKLF